MHARLLVMFSIALAATLVACKSDRAGTPEVTPVTALSGYDVIPRIYDLPAGRVMEVRRLLQSMRYPVTSHNPTHGSYTEFHPLQVTFTSDRHLVVTAPAPYHAAIAGILEQLAATPATPSGYEVTYWIVKAEPVAAKAIAPELQEIAPVLDGLSALGPRRFVMLDRLSARTVDGDEATLSGQVANVQQQLTAMPDAVDLELELTLHVPGASRPQQLKTQLLLKPDVPVVLGDSSAPNPNLDAPAALLLYVVRVRALP